MIIMRDENDPKENYKDENDINEFLFSISDDIVEINIREQIKECRDKTENYFAYIITKIDSFKIYLSSEDQTLINKLDLYKDQICDIVEEELEERFGISIDFQTELSRDKNLLVIYDCLVMRHNELLENIVTKFIEREKKSLVSYFSNQKLNKKDLSYINNKKMANKDNILMLMNMHEIIEMVKVQDCDDLIELMIDDEEEAVYSLFLDFIRTNEIGLTIELCDIFNDDIQKNKNELMMIARMDYMK